MQDIKRLVSWQQSEDNRIQVNVSNWTAGKSFSSSLAVLPTSKGQLWNEKWEVLLPKELTLAVVPIELVISSNIYSGHGCK